MFSKILIANRGEIACRIMRTCRRLGIATVAVYSDADKQALHVDMADESVRIGAPPSSESYLRAAAIIEACKQTQAQAVHPGYGFLSENADFSEALEGAGITFIGPKRHAIEAMGDKITAKRIAEEAKVNTVPGFQDVIQSEEHAVAIARQIGYPVMLKASAGGGGKGMRIANDDAECEEGFARATSEARASFGDDRIFIEKFIERPRHIEIQVLADRHGNTIALGERECSIQRRHQKIIEEAPSPFLDDATRKAMCAQAVSLARAVGYESAGTVEFIVDQDRGFYFLEMNTRLQVEHPVTEYVTGLDLVEWMIRIAAGETLTLPDTVATRGWAVEARVYAEDPTRHFMPSVGRLTKYRAPREDANIRVDTGVNEGNEVSVFYDPMIAKVIAYGDDRAEAVERLKVALDEFCVRGVSHNMGFMQAVMSLPQFEQGDLSTNLIAEAFPDGFSPHALDSVHTKLLAVIGVMINRRFADRASQLSGGLPGHARRLSEQWVVYIGDETLEAKVRNADQVTEVALDGETHIVESEWPLAAPVFWGRIDNREVRAQVTREGMDYHLTTGGFEAVVKVLTPRVAALNAFMLHKEPPDLSRFLLSPMPGLLVSLKATPGQKVKSGETLAVIEAMKMENSLQAMQDGTVVRVLAEVGDSLSVDQPIVEFE